MDGCQSGLMDGHEGTYIGVAVWITMDGHDEGRHVGLAVWSCQSGLMDDRKCRHIRLAVWSGGQTCWMAVLS